MGKNEFWKQDRRHIRVMPRRREADRASPLISANVFPDDHGGWALDLDGPSFPTLPFAIAAQQARRRAVLQ
jgi:hypothetical protein